MPGGRGNIRHEDGKPFSSENQPLKRRPPRLFSQLSKEWQEAGIERATPERVQEAYEFLLALSLPNIREIAGRPDDQNNDLPAIIRLAAKEMFGKRSLEIVREMLDRAHGKPRQSLDLTTHEDAAREREFTPEQIAQMQQVLNQGNAKQDSGGSISASKRRKGNP